MATNLDIGSIPITFKRLDGGLNTTSGPLGVTDNEASDLQNVDFDRFGSVLERNGYYPLNTTPSSTSGTGQGIYWYNSLYDRTPIMVNEGKIYKMDALDGTWDDITGEVSLATGGVDNKTKLLLHCDGADGSTTFIDSAFGHVVTANGTTQIDTTQYKFGGASALFTTLGDYLSIADNVDWDFGVGDFTIDFRLRFADVTKGLTSCWRQWVDSDNYIDCGSFAGGAGTEFAFSVKSAGVTICYYYFTWTPVNDMWYHLAFVRYGNTFKIYINGISQTITEGTSISGKTFPTLAADPQIYVARASGTGWIDEFRISKGVARWTANFTPETTAYGDYQYHDFDTFLGYALGCDNVSQPWQWLVSNSTASAMAVVTGLTSTKFIKKFQNYCVMANVKVSGVKCPSRFYWSGIRSITSWDAADWIEVSKDDGDEITGLKVLGDRLVIYKNTSIYVAIFTGDADIPFIVQKTNSNVGCVASFSIQEIENGHCFVSQDGIYYFDGWNSYKISDKITKTFNGLNSEKLDIVCSMYQKKKNMYWLGCPSGTSLYNNFILGWNSYLKAWTKYAGFSTSAMSIFLINGTDERPYFVDYKGYAYRADYGIDDYPANVKATIDAYWYSNWKSYDDICDKKGIPHVYIVHTNESSTNLTFAYSYDFYNGDQYSSTFSLFTTQTVTGLTTRRDLTGRGNFVRFGFKNSASGTTFRLDGLGTYVTRESNI